MSILTSPYFSLFGLILGSVVTWFFAWLYFKKAGDELRTEAEQLRKKNDLVIYCLTNPGAEVAAKYDSAGNVVGLIVSATGSAKGLSFTGHADLGQRA